MRSPTSLNLSISLRCTLHRSSQATHTTLVPTPLQRVRHSSHSPDFHPILIQAVTFFLPTCIPASSFAQTRHQSRFSCYRCIIPYHSHVLVSFIRTLSQVVKFSCTANISSLRLQMPKQVHDHTWSGRELRVGRRAWRKCISICRFLWPSDRRDVGGERFQ